MSASADRIARTVFAAAALTLVRYPLARLAATRSDPSYGSAGQLHAAAMLAMGAVSVRSGPARGAAPRLLGCFSDRRRRSGMSQILAIHLTGGPGLARGAGRARAAVRGAKNGWIGRRR